MRVLITNNTLAARAGTELYVRDLATSLLKRGITPIAYSTQLGAVADELRLATVPVIDNLDALATPPDLIHGQHHLDTMTALLRFPGVPAIYFCHGWLPWEEMPPRFPRILRYLAVDCTCRDRLIYEHAIPEDQIRVLLNFVDLERFKSRGTLPPRPERALIFDNDVNESSYLRTTREACERAGIRLEVIGANAGNATAHPETLLGGYDLVFARGRSALEALAIGAAVVVCAGPGIGEMVTTNNLDRLRSLNFGIRTMQDPITTETIMREITHYDADDAAEVSRRIRATAGREAVVDDLLSLYKEVIAEYASRQPNDLPAECRATSDYLRMLSPRLKNQNALYVALDKMQKERDRLQSAYDSLEAGQAADQEDAAVLREQLTATRVELDRIRNTFGWRMLNRYGPIKHRLLMPAYQSIKRLFKGK